MVLPPTLVSCGYSSGAAVVRNADERIAKHAEAQIGCPVTFTYTRREGRELVERAGFRVHDVSVPITCSRTGSATTCSTAT